MADQIGGPGDEMGRRRQIARGGKSSNETVSVGSLALTPLGLYGMDVEEGKLSEEDGIFKTSEHPPPVQENQGFDTRFVSGGN